MGVKFHFFEFFSLTWSFILKLFFSDFSVLVFISSFFAEKPKTQK